MGMKQILLSLLLLLFCWTASLHGDEVNPPEVNTSDQPDPGEELEGSLVGTILLAPLIGAHYFLTNCEYDLEGGYVTAGYSDVRIPGDIGTLFSLSDELKSDPAAFFRARVTLPFLERHSISILYAPLWIRSTGGFDHTVHFTDKTFEAGEEIKALYTFNSFRLTYRYELVTNYYTQFGLGLTGKIRNAQIRLNGDNKTARSSNTGFVPLINFRLHHYLTDKLGVLLEGDALAAPQGRAEDVFVGLTWKESNHFKFKAGYRMLEGGADNDKVYTFGMYNYLALGVEARFRTGLEIKGGD